MKNKEKRKKKKIIKNLNDEEIFLIDDSRIILIF
jgi:hypothetical protein